MVAGVTESILEKAVLSWFQNQVENQNIRVVTAYRPSLAEWTHNFKVTKPK